MKVKFIDIQALYEKTSSSSGLVHAVAGPILVDDRYTVHLGPIGRQGHHELLDSEEEVKRMVHGLLHGLAAIHSVSDRGMKLHELFIQDLPHL